jgi:nicotinate-nucleotide adenylyltransferase
MAVPPALRIGVFGGAFDPPHAAHRQLVEVALATLSLDQLRLIPTGQAWHKARSLTPAQHRLAMCQLAFGDLSEVHIDPRETQRQGPSFTVDTLQELQTQWAEEALRGTPAQWFLLIGGDQAEAFPTWKNAEKIHNIATVIVANRGHVYLQNNQKTVENFKGKDFRILPMNLSPISSSVIRQRVAHGALSALVDEGMVADAVARYIDAHQLYRESE